MEENLGEKIFNIMTENYKDKIDKNKNLKNYLKEQSKRELLSVYLSYGYATNIEDIIEQIVYLQKEKKEDIIEKILEFLDDNFYEILKFISPERMMHIKKIANSNDFYEFCINKQNEISLDTIKILKQLNLIFCKKEKDTVMIHMPLEVKKLMNSVVRNLYSEYYDKIVKYSKGIADTYGVIKLEDAYNIISKDIIVEFERYESIIEFVSLLELQPIYYSFARQCICNFNLHDEEIDKILYQGKNLKIYDYKTYMEIGKETFLFGLKEYKEFRNFLKEYYRFDINNDDMLRGEIIDDYIDEWQINKKEAKDNLINSIDNYFEVDVNEKNKIIEYVDRIKERFPIWTEGGKMRNIRDTEKIGRNEKCPCGSGRKYKQCCGK